MTSMWEKEPDLDELNRLYSLLSTDPSQALTGLRALAERGSVMSMVYLGTAYRDGAGTRIDLAAAEEWFRRATEAGSVHASYELGLIYYFDAKEYGKAQETFLIGATRDFAPSMRMLALMCLRGAGVPVDTARARDLLEGAAAQGHVYAKRTLGALLMRGRFGAWQIVRGLFLFLTAFSDAVTIVFRSRHDDRLR